ncbi:histone chaperone asf1 [Neocloeon triangulifer]|uniref:histone chaperone asf1 n=1 Tax=Neocloeon triangulifer TaxID=2078957 RepID=UPI00286EE64E|nr:histone chaperone asf1 [Neocloeon triangulifer]
MAKIHLSNVVVLGNPSPFLHPFQFEVTFECNEELKEDLEWKVIYVGSAESEEHDQTLDTIYVGPIPEGRHMFVFQAACPDVTRIPEADALGVTVVLLTCSYRNQEFVRVGYFINNEYTDPELRENPPTTPQYDKIARNILATAPRVTRFKIDWDNLASVDQSGEGQTKIDGGVPELLSDNNGMADGPVTSLCQMNGVGGGTDMICDSTDTVQNDNSQSNLNAMDLM